MSTPITTIAVEAINNLQTLRAEVIRVSALAAEAGDMTLLANLAIMDELLRDTERMLMKGTISYLVVEAEKLEKG
jgi:hypothetical protein